MLSEHVLTCNKFWKKTAKFSVLGSNANFGKKPQNLAFWGQIQILEKNRKI
jgi:hypothetical protein